MSFKEIAHFDKESDFEDSFISLLQECGWEKDVLKYPTEEDLLKGVSANDSRSGDVSDTLVIESLSDFTEEGKRIITYAAVDESMNVGRCERTIVYE
ncbi:hypothetical protein IJX73_05560, partial [bacterium]|nr:hypothetical protein [bacterium]